MLVLEAQQRRRDGNLYYTQGLPLRLLQHPLVKPLNLGLGQAPGLVRVLVHKMEEVFKGEILTDSSGRLFFGALMIFSMMKKFLDAAVKSLLAMDRAVTFR